MNKILRQAGAGALILTLTSYGVEAQPAAINDAAAQTDMAPGAAAPMGSPVAAGPAGMAAHHPDDASNTAGIPMGMAGAIGTGAPSMMVMMEMMQTMGGMMERGAAMSAAGMMRFDHMAGRVAFLKAELAITPAQAPQWDAFAAALKTAAEKVEPMRTRMLNIGTSATLPDRLRAEADLLDTRAAAMHRVVETASALYGVLTPAQRTQADTLMVGPMGMM